MTTYLYNELQFDRYKLLRGDIRRVFVADPHGDRVDLFGRRGNWMPRGTRVHHDADNGIVIKTYSPACVAHGVGYFLDAARKSSIYQGLTPLLRGWIVDQEGLTVGYATTAARQITEAEYAAFVSNQADTIKANTVESGYYFYDLCRSNIVAFKGTYSLIDLESILPLSWFEQDDDFSKSRLDQIDIGYSLQRKWFSPWWYHQFLCEHLGLKPRPHRYFVKRVLLRRIFASLYYHTPYWDSYPRSRYRNAAAFFEPVAAPTLRRVGFRIGLV